MIASIVWSWALWKILFGLAFFGEGKATKNIKGHRVEIMASFEER